MTETPGTGRKTHKRSEEEKSPRCLEWKQYSPAGIPLWIARAGAHGSNSGHSHTFYELVYVHHGSGIHSIDDHPYPMLQGDCYLMLPGETHSYQTDKPFGIYNVLFQHEALNEEQWQQYRDLPGLKELFDPDSSKHKIALSPEHASLVSNLCERMANECRQQVPGWHLLVQSLFQELLITLSRAWATYGDLPSHESMHPGIISQVIAYIHAHWDENLTVAELAAEAGLSRNWFGESFQKQTGLTVQAYINKLRIDHARQLLEDHNESITAIAGQVGFDDPSYFSRVFKQHTGKTPRAYRRMSA